MWQDDATKLVLRSSSDDLTAWFVAARGGDSAALGKMLQAFNPYLSSIARRDVPGTLRGKCDGEDLVQETLLAAHLGFLQFLGRDVDDFRAWLRGILKHVISAHIRRYRDTHKRSLVRELSLEGYLELCLIADEPVDPEQTARIRVIAGEQSAALARALERLPDDDRLVIHLRSRDSLSFGEIGCRMNRSPEAARKLWGRAVARLRRML